MALRRPSLDDVFMSLTGHAAEEAAGDEKANGAGRKSRRGGRGASSAKPGGGR
jgi:ABC-2 type transport system ATP-binding protein